MQSCFTPIASASAAAPEPVCGIRFHCCSQFASASSCCSPIAHASAAARRLRPLQLLLPIASASAATPRLRPLQFLLPDCVRFNCCSPIASASTAARPLRLLLPDCIHPPLAGFHPMPGSNVLEHSSRSSRFSK